MKKILAFIVAAILCLTCFAACGKKNEAPQNNESTPTQVVYDVEDATAYLKNMYKKYLTETETAADFTLVSQVMKGGVVYKVTWTTDREDIKVIADEANKQVTIDLNEKTKVDIAYKLTATITDPEGKTSTLTFELKVPKYVLSSWDEYMAMEAGKAVVVEGYIAAVHAPSEGNKYNTLYLHDVNNKGGYYIYSMADSKDLVKDLGLKKGMLVSVTGTKDIYSGTHEIKDASVNVLDTNVVDLTPLDITATYKAATSLKDKALTDKLGMLVTIKGVEITDQDLAEKSMYMNFRLAGLTSYLRVYATDCPASVTDKGQQSIITEHGKKKGYSADVTGVVVMYSGAIYLNPVSDTPFKYGKKIERTPAQMVELEMDEVKFDKDIALDKTIELPSKGKTYEDVVITWASNSDAIVIEDGKAKITLQAEDTKASITGTFTLGTITKTKTIEFNLAKKSSIVPQIVENPVNNKAYKLFFAQTANGEYRYFTGEMASGSASHYGSSTVVADEGVDVYAETAGNGYYIYFNKGNEKNYITMVTSGTYVNFVFQTTKPSVPFSKHADYNNAPYMTMTVPDGDGTKDVIYFLGTWGTYTTFGTSSIEKYSSTTYIAYLGEMVDSSSISDDKKVADEKAALTVSDDEIKKDAVLDLAVKGSIHEDVTITWASNNACAVVNGGEVTITLGDTAQTVTLTATLKCGNVTDTKTFTITVVSKAEAITPADIVNSAYALAQGATLSGGPHTLTGIITSIDTPYSSQFSNVTVTIVVENLADKPIQCFRLKGTGADVIGVGDTITVTGTIKNYYGKVEFDQGCSLDSYKTASAIVDELYTLSSGQSLEGKYALKGVIKSIDNAYSSQHKNITVTIDVDGVTNKPVQCYRLKGDKAADLAVGDTITVYGALKRYNNTFEFDQGCEIISYEAAPVNDGSTKVTLVAADLGLANDADFTCTNVDSVITVSAAKGSGSNAPKYYDSGTNLRIYTNNTFTITAASGYKITSIKFVCSSAKSMLTNAITVSTGTAEYNTTNKTTTITGIDASTFSFTNTKPTDGDSESKQIRITSIEISYVAE